ncbi:hypothetical protein NMG60_11028450 [Bertholletia excelsa]
MELCIETISENPENLSSFSSGVYICFFLFLYFLEIEAEWHLGPSQLNPLRLVSILGISLFRWLQREGDDCNPFSGSSLSTYTWAQSLSIIAFIMLCAYDQLENIMGLIVLQFLLLL